MLKFSKEQLLKLVTQVPRESELLLVHDQGVYIMSAVQPIGQRTIIHAEGCNPDTDDDWWETARRLVGGDDFGEPFATAGSILQALAAANNGLTIAVTETRFVTETY